MNLCNFTKNFDFENLTIRNLGNIMADVTSDNNRGAAKIRSNPSFSTNGLASNSLFTQRPLKRYELKEQNDDY